MNHRGQNEIVGFVMIIVIVTIVGLIFLSLALGRGDDEKTSAEINYFLQASMDYTTDCATGFIPQYKDLKSLIKSCYNNELEKCLNDQTVCESLNLTVNKLMNSYGIGGGSSNKAINLTLYSEDNSTSYEPFLIKQIGIFSNCSSIVGSSNQIDVSTGINLKWINFELDVCKK